MHLFTYRKIFISVMARMLTGFKSRSRLCILLRIVRFLFQLWRECSQVLGADSSSRILLRIVRFLSQLWHECLHVLIESRSPLRILLRIVRILCSHFVIADFLSCILSYVSKNSVLSQLRTNVQTFWKQIPCHLIIRLTQWNRSQAPSTWLLMDLDSPAYLRYLFNCLYKA